MANRKKYVINASGENIPFSPEKLAQSLRHSGADEKTIAGITREISRHIYDGVSTKKIYRQAYAMLRKRSPHFGGRYKLKEALLELGPSGFPFEKFVARVLHHRGYETKLNVIMQGSCVRHEVDVLAAKDNNEIMIECKYHNQRGLKSDVKIPLYVHSRFRDIQRYREQRTEKSLVAFTGWLVTNTRFTGDAYQYGTCAGLHLVSWDQPENESLKEMIDMTGLHPLTCMSSLSKSEKIALLHEGVVLCNDLENSRDLLYKMDIPPARVERIIREAGRITQNAMQEPMQKAKQV
ncbi:MAG TPA: restriction endonuclease [Bacteroidia bacterium]|nr:restriction endonuclease [Bacteroidia bacterium]